VGEHVPDGDEDGVFHGDQGPLLAAAGDEPAVAGREVGVFGPRRGDGGLAEGCLAPGSPCRVLPGPFLPPDSLLPGQTPAQEARSAAVGKRAMSSPISASTTSAARVLTPGMATSSSMRRRKGAICASVRSSKTRGRERLARTSALLRTFGCAGGGWWGGACGRMVRCGQC
jgi:hypothetical protein